MDCTIEGMRYTDIQEISKSKINLEAGYGKHER